MGYRFFIEESSFDHPISLTGSEFHHLSRVMRLQEGDAVELVNGQGVLAHARIQALHKEDALLHVLDRTEEDLPSPTLILGLPLFRLTRLEWAIEKGTELGADGFYLFPAERSEQKTLTYHQLARLRHLAIAALKQCGRLYLPEITLCESLTQLLDLDARILHGDPSGSSMPPREHLLAHHQILFLSGPEGGFSERERLLLDQNGSLPVKLHKNILRAETAPLTALYHLFCMVRSF